MASENKIRNPERKPTIKKSDELNSALKPS